MKANVKIEFPCGYKYELDLEQGIFQMNNLDETIPKECPLHGKNCIKDCLVRKKR